MNRRPLSRRSFLKSSAVALAGVAAAPLVRPFVSSSALSRPSIAPDLPAAELIFFLGANDQELATRKKIIDAFNVKFPQIKITVDLAGPDPTQKLLTEVAGGAPPDIMMAWELDYSGLAIRNVYADLGTFIAKDADYKANVVPDIVPVLLDMFTWAGKLYVLPEQFAGVVLYYNKKLFDAAGVAYPPSDWKDTSWNYDKFLATATALTKKDADGKVVQYGFADAWWQPLSAAVWAYSNGGNWFDRYVNPTKSTISDPKFSEAVQFYADLANVHHVAPTSDEAATQAGPDMFMGGRAAMALTGHWFYPAFSNTDGLDFEVAVFPVGPHGTTAKTDTGSTGLAISNVTKYPDQCWEFVKFAAGPEGQRIIAESGLFVPVLQSVGKSDSFLKAHTKIKNASVFIDAVPNSIQLPITPNWAKISDVWARETDAVMRGKATATDADARIEAAVNTILSGQ